MVAAAAALSAWALDTAGTTVALPTIQTSLGISVTASQWVLNLAFLALAGLVSLGGFLGDRKGRVRIFTIGLLVFLAGSIAAPWPPGSSAPRRCCSPRASWRAPAPPCSSRRPRRC